MTGGAACVDPEASGEAAAVAADVLRGLFCNGSDTNDTFWMVIILFCQDVLLATVSCMQRTSQFFELVIVASCNECLSLPKIFQQCCAISYRATPGASVVSSCVIRVHLPATIQPTSLEIWIKIAARPVGSFFHTVLLDKLEFFFFFVGVTGELSTLTSLMMLFMLGMVPGVSGSIAACFKSVGQSMPFDRGAIPVLEVGTMVEALLQHLGGTHCPRQPLLLGLLHARTTIGLNLLASIGGLFLGGGGGWGVGGFSRCLFLVGAFRGFFRFF